MIYGSLLACAGILAVEQPIVTESFLDRLAHAETRSRAGAVGDLGRSRSMFQMRSGAWADVTKVRKARGLWTAPFADARIPWVARIYARDYLGIKEDQFVAAKRRPPTERELVCCWNVGFSKFRKLGFKFERCPKTTQRLWARFQQAK